MFILYEQKKKFTKEMTLKSIAKLQKIHVKKDKRKL